MSVRQRLQEMDRTCVELCKKHGHLASGRCPNFMLLYSTPETFERPADVMFVGWNPGGGEDAADRHPHRTPFDKRRGWSPYLDETWDKPVRATGGNSARFEKGEHPMQRAVQSTAELIAGSQRSGIDLIRASPAGNLIPFRSEASDDLPRALQGEGIRIGLELVSLARPRLLVLLSGKQKLWESLMKQIGHTPEPDWTRDLGAKYTFREAPNAADGTPRFVFSLPGVNTRIEHRNREVIDLLRQRLDHHGLTRRVLAARPRLVKK